VLSAVKESLEELQDELGWVRLVEQRAGKGPAVHLPHGDSLVDRPSDPLWIDLLINSARERSSSAGQAKLDELDETLETS
jgi:hypothetical protein